MNLALLGGFCMELCFDIVQCVGGGCNGVGVLVVQCTNEVQGMGLAM